MSAIPSLPPIETLPKLSASDRTQILDLLFEPSPALHTLSLPLTLSTPSGTFTDPPAPAIDTTPSDYPAFYTPAELLAQTGRNVASLPGEIHAPAPNERNRSRWNSYVELVAAVGQQLTTLAASHSPADAKTLVAILASHPRLGEKKVESAMSRMEQERMVQAAHAHAGTAVQEQGKVDGQESKKDGGVTATVTAVPGGEEEELKRLNEEYETAFPGLRFVTFVNGRPRTLIMDEMRARIQRGNIVVERQEAIRAMCVIAVDRVEKIQGFV